MSARPRSTGSRCWGTFLSDTPIASAACGSRPGRRNRRSASSSLVGPVDDQSALTGMLDSLAEYHLPILAVERIAEIGEDGEPQGPRSN